jgi:hypothetical protein
MHNTDGLEANILESVLSLRAGYADETLVYQPKDVLNRVFFAHATQGGETDATDPLAYHDLNKAAALGANHAQPTHATPLSIPNIIVTITDSYSYTAL